MANLKLRRICLADSDADQRFADLRKQLSPQGDVVTPKGKALTEAVFGAPLSPKQVVERICEDVQKRGLEAVLYFTEKFDQVRLDPQTMRVSQAELEAAHVRADQRFLETIRRVRANILAFQTGVLNRDAVLTVSGSHELRLRYRPLRRVGVCVPGGAAAYPSTVLMTVVPAQAAGVPEIVLVVPPSQFGGYNRDLLAVCRELGLREIYRIGGAQAVAMLAYGVDGVEPVDMIVGPGNLFVTLAKRHVFGQVAIDMLAGPSEIVVLADDTARPDYVAADMIAQAEHAPGASILISWHPPFLDQVEREINKQLPALPRGELASESLERFGALVEARDVEEAVECANRLAPEHLHIQARQAASLVDRLPNAGAIFCGNYSPVALGDYAAGPSHVLPTGGTARFSSGLCANDFLRRSSVLSFEPAGLRKLAGDVCLLAEKEGLTAHAASVAIRLQTTPNDGATAPAADAVASEKTVADAKTNG
ncbi:MAG: histidinol dehydrogenase [Gemmatales bacterium]|nr:MAG: histidinol dehydrogenase [Gemmatales bacterium]